MMPGRGYRTIFEDGLKNFKDKLTPDQRDKVKATTFQEFEAAMSVVQERQRLDGTMRSMRRLKGFLDAIEAYSSPLDVFSNVHEVVAFIWGPMKFLLLVSLEFKDSSPANADAHKMARTSAEAFDSLIGAYEKMARYIPLLGDYGIHLETDARGERFLEMVFQDIFEFHRLALDLFQKSSWKQLFRTNWNRFQTNFQRLLSNLEANNNLIQKQADLREFANNARERDEAAERFRTQQAEGLRRRRGYLQSWLPSADIEADHERHVAARKGHAQSGRWLLSRREFSEWFHSTTAASSFLWIHGMPGAGKTVLASVIIEEAKTRPWSNVFYFYFRHGDEQRNSFIALARSLLQQALQCEESIVTHLFETATKSGQTSLTSKRKAADLLDFCFDLLPGHYILDGLDECPEEEQETVVHWFDKFMGRSAQRDNHSRCVFLSQNDNTARRLLFRRPTLRITQGDNYTDIQSYCISKASEVGLRFGLPDVKISHLAHKTCQNADGMFLFARLVLEHLYCQDNEEALDEQIRDGNFPRGLDQAYGRVLERILGGAHATYKWRTKRLLSWLTCAVRPLKWREIQTAMSINSNTQTVDVDRRRFVDDAKTLCGSLIEEGKSGEVVLVHTTAKFYLQDPSHEHCINTAEADLDLASLCVDYFNFPIFQPDLAAEDLDVAILKGDFGFADYSIICWTQHLENTLLSHSSSTSQLDGLEESLDVFFESHWRDPVSRSAANSAPLECMQTLKEYLRSKCEATILALRELCTTHAADPRTHAPNDLFEVLVQIRSRTEKLADDPLLLPKLQQYYGTKFYKCSRVYCRWFHEGFRSAHHREYHKQKHERSHYCLEGGCYRAILGFATKAELDKHIKDYHQSVPSDEDFPEFYGGKTTQTQITGQKRPGENMCHICHKTYSKPSNLQAHLKIHNKDRVRFACSTCNKRFARETDLARHESIHSGGNTFVCGGIFESGESWGCGKTFARSDGLSRHFNSIRGQRCYMQLASKPPDDAIPIDEIVLTEPPATIKTTEGFYEDEQFQELSRLPNSFVAKNQHDAGCMEDDNEDRWITASGFRVHPSHYDEPPMLQSNNPWAHTPLHQYLGVGMTNI